MIAFALRALLAIAIPIVPYGGLHAIVDTGGTTESKAQRPLDFETVYRGLAVTYALGADYLVTHAVAAGYHMGAPKHAVKLDVRTSASVTAAFVDCTIGGRSYRMLLDTAALAWPSQSTSKPIAVLYLSSAAFQALHRTHPRWDYHPNGRWIVDSQGRFVEAASFVAGTSCGGVSRFNRLIVERTDDSTYQYLRQHFGIKVDGDASLSAFGGRGVSIDFPARALYIF